MNIFEFCEYVWKNSNDPKWFQPVMLIEECSELSKEMTKFLRGRGDLDHIAEEMADVEITMESIKYGFKIPNELIEKIKREKIERYCSTYY